MAASLRTPWSRIALQALVAGIAGAVIVDLFLWLATVLPQHGSMAATWTWVASTLIGRGVTSMANAPLIGLAIHLCVSIVWAGAYAWFASTRVYVNRRWLISGITYGAIVYLIMQVVLLVDNNFIYPPTPNAFVLDVIAHALFFGVPVAYTVKRLSA
jgi:hypothetical protein